LLSIEKYRKLTEHEGSIVDRLGRPPAIEDTELEIPPFRDVAQGADFS